MGITRIHDKHINFSNLDVQVATLLGYPDAGCPARKQPQSQSEKRKWTQLTVNICELKLFQRPAELLDYLILGKILGSCCRSQRELNMQNMCCARIKDG